MKKTITYLLLMMVTMLSNAAVLAEDSVLPQNPNSEKSVANTPADNNTNNNIDNNTEKNVAQKAAQMPFLATSPGDVKTGKPVAGEFPVMSQPDVGTGVIQVTLGLFVVLLIIGAAAWFTRRFGHLQSTAGGAMRIIGGLHLGTRERLVVVQVGDEQLLLGVAPGRVSTLHVLANPLRQDDSASRRTQQTSGAFLDKLNAVLKKEGK